MSYYTIIIPSDGIPYMENCPKYIKEFFNLNATNGFNISGGSIGITDPLYKLGVIVNCDFHELMNRDIVSAQIYLEDEDERDKYCGIDFYTATEILEKLKKRKWYLWNKPPKHLEEIES